MTSSTERRETALPAGARIGRVRLRVADLDRSLRFYRDVLGMRVVRDSGSTVALAPAQAAAAGAGRGEAQGADPTADAAPELLVLHELPGISRRPHRPRSTGLYHVAFLLPSRAELGRALLGLHAANYSLSGASDHSFSESLYLDDPDGNGLEIYADRPRASWRWAGGRVHVTSDPMDVEGVLAAADSIAERGSPWGGLPRDSTIGHLHFTVSRMEPAAEFYRDVVGFDETIRVPTLVGVAAGGYHHHLNLNTWAGEGAPPDSDRVAGLEAWELVLPDAAARDLLATRLGQPAPSPGGGDVTALDVDGVALDVVSATPDA